MRAAHRGAVLRVWGAVLRPLLDASLQERLDAAGRAWPAAHLLDALRAAAQAELPLAEAHQEPRGAAPLERWELPLRAAELRALLVAQGRRERPGESESRALVQPAQEHPDGAQPARQDAGRLARLAWRQPKQGAERSLREPRSAGPQGARQEPRVALEQLALERRGAAPQQERLGVGRQASPRV